MSRPKNKIELLDEAEKKFKALFDFIGTMSEVELNTEFDFSHDKSKKETHWLRDKNLRDVLIHLYEWQRLLIEFIDSNMKGIDKSFLPDGYNWKTYPEMNVEIWKKHQETSYDEAKDFLNKSHNAVLKLAQSLSDDELFEKKYYKWTGTTNLGAYFISTLSSHYDWAIKKLKEHRKNLN